VVELQQLPSPLLEQRGIQNVMSWYSSYVGELVTFPKPMNQEEVLLTYTCCSPPTVLSCCNPSFAYSYYYYYYF